MFAPRRPEAAAADAPLRRHLMMLGAWCGLIRATPYVLQYLQDASA